MSTYACHSVRALATPVLAATVAGAACSAPAERPVKPAAQTANREAATRPSVAPGAADPVWHYEAGDPARWGSLSPKFAACSEGRAQSPIDVADATPVETSATLKMRFPTAELRIAHHEHVADGINNGHTIQINYAGGDTLTIRGEAYGLVQYHFHNPSEHTVKGSHFPMEMHMVHKSAGGRLAVVGVLIEQGAHNDAFDPIWNNLPTQKGLETHYPHVNVDVDALLPTGRKSYRYDGSLTTPPCTEGVQWIVMTMPIQLSADQIRAFTNIIHDNTRPTQPRNGRPIVTEPVLLTSR